MGAGNSIQIENQERYVRDNIDKYRNITRGLNYTQISDNQIRGKLRQLYWDSDTTKTNKDSYILHNNWINIKNKIK